MMVLIAFFTTTTAWAAVRIGDISYELDDNSLTAEIVQYCYLSGNVILPTQVIYNDKTYRVTRIGAHAFSGCNLTSIVIPEGVVHINQNPFTLSNQNLTSVTFPESLLSIYAGVSTFENGIPYNDNLPDGPVYFGHVLCGYRKNGVWIKFTPEEANNITSIQVSPGTKGIAGFAFSDFVNLNSVTLPEGLKCIEQGAFKGCTSLTTITLPSTLEYIGESAFDGCTNLTTINFPDGVKHIGYHAFNGTAWLDAQPDGPVYLGNWLLEVKGTPANNIAVSVRPGTRGICALGEKVTQIAIPEGVKYFDPEFRVMNELWGYQYGQATWQKFDLEHVFCLAAPNEISYMWRGEEYTVASRNSAINSTATFHVADASKWSKFAERGLTVDNMDNLIHGTCGAAGHEDDVTWDYDPFTQVITIAGTGEMMDDPCNVSHGIVGERWYPFCDGIQTININNGVTYIGQRAFYRCINVAEINATASIDAIGQYSFANDGMPWYDVQHDGLIYLESVVWRFKGDKSEDAEKIPIILKEGTKGIAEAAFTGCHNIVSFTFPASLTHVGKLAFTANNNVTDVYCYANPDNLTWGKTNNIFKKKNTLFHVQAEHLSTYLEKWDKLNDPNGTNIQVTFVGDLPKPIRTTDDWNALAAKIASGNTGEEVKYYCLENDITVTTMLGTSDHPFTGTFIGNDHTITLNLNQPGEQSMAPFRYIQNATIRDLIVEGNVSGARHSSGLVGSTVGGTNVIENCVINANITCSEAYCGGIVGHGGNSANYTLRGCVFNGSFGGSASTVGTLWGWSDAGTTLAISDCIDMSSTTHCIGNGAGTITVQNTYYTNPTKLTVGTRYWSAELQGTRAYSNATLPTNIGDAIKNYGSVVSYTSGLGYDERYYNQWASNPQPVMVTFCKEGYSTYYDSQYDMTLTAGMKARIITAKAGGNTLTYQTIADGDLIDVATEVVPAGTAVLLQVAPTDGAQTIKLTMTAPSAAAIGQNNLLYGSDEATTTTGGDQYYKLSYNRDGNEKTIGWYWGAQDAGAFTSGAHKAWLALPSNGQHAPLHFIGLPGFYEGTTDVVLIPYQPVQSVDVWYDIYGRKFNEQPTTSGLYIHNGKTVMIIK